MGKKGFYQKNKLSVFAAAVLILMSVAALTSACSKKEKIDANAPVSSIISEETTSSEESTPATTPSTTTTATTTSTTTTSVTTTTTTAKTTVKPDGKTTAKPTSAKPTTTTPKVVVPPTVKNAVATLMVTAKTADIHSEINTDSAVIGKVSQNTKLEIIGYDSDSKGNIWYYVRYKTGTGFILSSAVTTENVKAGTAYLTFDDGPSANTAKILDVLDKYNVKATFFVKYNKGFDSIYKQIVNRGNSIGNHTYSHNYSEIYKNDQAFFDNISKMQSYIKSTTGAETKLIRFPGGSSNAVSKSYSKKIMTRLTKSTAEKGYTYFDWNVDSGDATETTAKKSKILNNIKSTVGVKNQVVILMHDSKNKTTTAEALPEIIEYLMARGYTIAPITPDTPAVHHSRLNN